MMKRELFWLVIGFFVAGATAVWASTSATITLDTPSEFSMKRLTVKFRGDGTSAATVNIPAGFTDTLHGNIGMFSGHLYSFTTIPAAGGDAPSALWDLTLADRDGVDALQGFGANRSATTTESVTLAYPQPITREMQVRASNMGTTNTATLVLYFR